jgi:hypothetical protein
MVKVTLIDISLQSNEERKEIIINTKANHVPYYMFERDGKLVLVTEFTFEE